MKKIVLFLAAFFAVNMCFAADYVSLNCTANHSPNLQGLSSKVGVWDSSNWKEIHFSIDKKTYISVNDIGIYDGSVYNGFSLSVYPAVEFGSPLKYIRPVESVENGHNVAGLYFQLTDTSPNPVSSGSYKDKYWPVVASYMSFENPESKYVTLSLSVQRKSDDPLGSLQFTKVVCELNY